MTARESSSVDSLPAAEESSPIDGDVGRSTVCDAICQPAVSSTSPCRDAAVADSDLPLSKRARKRLVKQQEKCEWRRQQKEGKIAEREEREQAHHNQVGSELAEDVEQFRLAKLERQRLRQEKDEEFRLRCEAGFTVAIDCDFEDLMNDREVNSMCQQVMRSYGANRQAQKPVRLCLAGRRAGGKVSRRLAAISGSDGWVAVKVHERGITELYDPADLVYLTSESPNELSALETDKVYVIGGIVDRNRHKGCSFEKASRDNLATARLPIGAALARLSSSQVLAINHVFEILLQFHSTGSWEQAVLSALPSRKHDRSSRSHDECEGSDVELKLDADS